MRARLTEEQEDYQRALRDWLGKVADAGTVRRWLDDADEATFAARMESDGIAGVGLPEEIGGQGGGLHELAITAQELGRACVPSAAWLASVLAAPALGAVEEVTLLVPRRGGTASSYVVPVRAGDDLGLGRPAGCSTSTRRRTSSTPRPAQPCSWLRTP